MTVKKETTPHKYVEIAIPLSFQKNFTYQVTDQQRELLRLGARVLVPFGKRTVMGFVVSDRKDLEADLDPSSVKGIKEIVDLEPLVDETILELCKWAADYYMVSLGALLKTALPSGTNARLDTSYSIGERAAHALSEKPTRTSVRSQILEHIKEKGSAKASELAKIFGAQRSRRALAELSTSALIIEQPTTYEPRITPKKQKAVRLTDYEPTEHPKALTDPQLRVIETVRTNGGEMLFVDLLRDANVSASPITKLIKIGVLDLFMLDLRRDPLADLDPPPSNEDLVLNKDQNAALSSILETLSKKEFKVSLLHGVTGSGKTEVYLRAMKDALARGNSSLMLVPEIALTPIFSRRLRSEFGDNVSILHSGLSSGERFDEWERIRRGEARITIGTRSAVFAPLRDLGLIIVDEEHDGSYRQNESPGYNGRDLAVVRAKFANAAIVLGSATPSIETFHNAQLGKYHYLHLPERIGGRPLAEAQIVDMREVFKSTGRDVVISPQLSAAIEATQRKGEQTIILLNRRGYSSFVLCRSCGESLRCKNCDIALTYHRSDKRIVCHYCNYSVDVPDKCPFCNSEFLYFIGQGTEQIEDLLTKRFDQFRIARLDRDATRHKGQIREILYAFEKGEIDILVGTQMVAKGHDFHNVTLVGVVSVDVGIGLPDFRSAERTFQLLTQVAGRAGRGTLPGLVMVQTYYPDHYALRHAADQNFHAFYDEEIKYRERMGYPPFVVLASIQVKHKTEKYALRSAQLLRDALDSVNSDRSLRILGPAPAPIARIKNEFRFQIIIKASSRTILRARLISALERAQTLGCDRRIVNVDIDPVSLF